MDAYIRTIEPDDAEGRLKALYDAAIARASKVYNIVKIMSLRPAQIRDSMALYGTLMHAPSGLSRAEREMVATVVSRLNECHY